MEDKREIRQKMRLLRRAMREAERGRVSKEVCAKLLARDDIREAIAARRPIAVYLASSEEVDLTDFIVSALAQGASLVAPRWNGVRYELAPLTSLGNLIVGPHGILEPSAQTNLQPSTFNLQPVLWLLPGLAFTKDGKRLGYGGGWYDRLLSESDPTSVRLGIAFGCQVVEDLPMEPHDRLLTEIVS